MTAGGITAVRLLADDLTGALDAGAEFARDAAPLHVFWHGSAHDLPASAAIDAGTREKSGDEARSIVAALTPGLATGALAFKKVDSLMRGATLAELASCFAAGPWRRAVFAPAFPFQGRVTRLGRQWAALDGEWRPVGPPLIEALRQEGAVAQAGAAGAPLPPGISVFDAESDAELRAIVASAGGAEPILWCGTGGLAQALASMEAIAPATLPRPILGLFGTDHPVTATQLAQCRPHWINVPERDHGVIAAQLDGEGLALASIALPSGLDRATAATRITSSLRHLAHHLPRPGTLLVAGGATLRSLCLALDATSLELEGRIVPGLPRSLLHGGRWAGITVVSKSGAFGPPHLLRDLLAQNGFLVERTC